MTKKDSVKIFLLTVIGAAVFVGFFYIAAQHALVGIYGMIFFALYPKIKDVYQDRKKAKEEL